MKKAKELAVEMYRAEHLGADPDMQAAIDNPQKHMPDYYKRAEERLEAMKPKPRRPKKEVKRGRPRKTK